MAKFKSDMEPGVVRRLASDLFNFTWELIEHPNRTDEEDEMMVNAAHASRLLWGMVGTAVNLSTGEWQISRAYALVLRPEPALHHAANAIRICRENGLGDFATGFAYEALARAYGVLGDVESRDTNLQSARACAERISLEEDRVWLLKNIDTVESLSLPIWRAST